MPVLLGFHVSIAALTGFLRDPKITVILAVFSRVLQMRKLLAAFSWDGDSLLIVSS